MIIIITREKQKRKLEIHLVLSRIKYSRLSFWLIFHSDFFSNFFFFFIFFFTLTHSLSLSSIFSLIPFIIPLSSYNLLIFSPPLFFFPYFHRPFFYFFLFAHRLNLITFTKACNWFFRRLKIRKIILRPSPPPFVCFRFRSPPFFTLPLIRIYIFIVLFLLR